MIAKDDFDLTAYFSVVCIFGSEMVIQMLHLEGLKVSIQPFI